MGQHRKYKVHNYTDLVCMAVPREFCNVIENKQLVTPVDPRLTSQREKTFGNVKVVHCCNTPVLSYNKVTSLCQCSSVIEARKVFVYVNREIDAA